MERGTKLISIGKKEFIIKSRYPSGQLKYQEDHYEIQCASGSMRITKSMVKFLFEDETEKEKKEEEAKLNKIKSEEMEIVEPIIEEVVEEVVEEDKEKESKKRKKGKKVIDAKG